MMKKNWIACNACGTDNFRQLSTVDEFTIGECGNCGLVFVNPIPVFEPNNEFSEMSKEFQYTQFQHQNISEEVIAHDSSQLQRHLEVIRELTGRRLERPRFLDVGCGSGGSVKAADMLGWKATGIDLDPQLIAAGRDKLQVDLRCVPLLDAGFESESFDFVRLRDVIEHLPNPYDALMEIKRLLAPGGVALFATPNEDGLPTRLRLLLGGQRTRVATVPPPHHIHGFTPKTLEMILQRTGMKTLQVTTTTPVDADYVTCNNMKVAGKKALVAFWNGAKALGRGSMLIGWVQKPGGDAGH